jgi:Importin 13 repeat
MRCQVVGVTRKVLPGFGLRISCQSFVHARNCTHSNFDTLQGTLLGRTSTNGELAEAKALLIQSHGRSILRAVLCGFAGVAPRSVVPNLIDLLSTLVNHAHAECKVWMRDILFAVCPIDQFLPSRAFLTQLCIGRFCAVESWSRGKGEVRQVCSKVRSTCVLFSLMRD